MELPDDYLLPPELSQLVTGDVTVFIDPLDGTREFVEGRLEAVQCLVGVAYRGRAVAGVVGVPWPRRGGSSQVLCGVVGSQSGVWGLQGLGQEAVAGEHELVLAISTDLGAKEVESPP